MQYRYTLSKLVLDTIDCILDIFICGRILSGSKEAQVVSTDYTSNQSCRYVVLKQVFDDFVLNKTDSFLEVGCGRGRVIAYLIWKDSPCYITGFEVNTKDAGFCKEVLSDNKHVGICCCDVFDKDISSYNVFFLGHPFKPVSFARFIDKIENEIKHSTIVISVIDKDNYPYLLHRTGWKAIKHSIIYRYFGIRVLSSKNSYTIWSYSPKK